MDRQNLTSKLEGFRNRNSTKHCYINKDVYCLMYERDLYYIAYNNIKSNDGAETTGSDGTSLHGFCEKWIDDIISSLRDESYQPKPNKITYIPKKNGRMRKLSFPNGKDKLVQEAVHIIRECIYEPTFSNLSHGFRPNRSIHSALAQINGIWNDTKWFIEGDISACFDEVDHRVLESILRERINDEKFIRLINKILRAGYFDMHHTFQSTKSGAAQGSTVSPILCNIYLDKLDRFMEGIIERDTVGKKRRNNPKYSRLSRKLEKARASKNKKLIKQIIQERSKTPAGDPFDENFRRINYARYADDFLIGTISSKKYAQMLKEEIKVFLSDVLHLRLSEEKTVITHAHNDKAHFLGYNIQMKKKHCSIFIDVNKLINKLKSNGMCKGDGTPTSMTSMLREDDKDIIIHGNNVLRGLVINNEGCTNYCSLSRIQYIVQFSVAMTLARRHNISLKQVFRKHSKSLAYAYLNDKGETKIARLALFHSFKWQYNFYNNWRKKIKEPIDVTYRTDNPLTAPCYICGTHVNLRMFHGKKISLLEKPYKPIELEMIRINRRQICLCNDCFSKVTNNLLEYNQLTKDKPH